MKLAFDQTYRNLRMINIEIKNASTTRNESETNNSFEKNFVVAKHLNFRLCGQIYAVALTKIREVSKLPQITRVAHAPPYIMGVCSLRGEIVPVVDLQKRFGLPMQALVIPSEQLILVTEMDTRKVAVVVDAVLDVIEIEIAERDIQPIPKSTLAIDLKYLLGMTQIENDLILIIDAPKLLDPSELHSIHEPK